MFLNHSSDARLSRLPWAAQAPGVTPAVFQLPAWSHRGSALSHRGPALSHRGLALSLTQRLGIVLQHLDMHNFAWLKSGSHGSEMRKAWATDRPLPREEGGT